jgi:Zn-dependent peptidase ImmA (M78 family)
MNRTTSHASTGAPSVLRTLRDLIPPRSLTLDEALQRAEVQASRLLSLQDISFPGVPSEIVTDLPKIDVHLTRDMPVSGSSHWEDGRWLIQLNEFDHPTRRRFSLLHEYKHILDHPFGDYIESVTLKGELLTHEQLAERVADHFAACVLMPKGWVKTAFCSRTQKIDELAKIFDVSPKAMNFRLTQLGLLSVNRCLPPSAAHYLSSARLVGRNGASRDGRRYFRSLASIPTIAVEPVGVQQ